MATESIVFDPDGDLCLRLEYTEEKKKKGNFNDASTPVESVNANLPENPFVRLRFTPIRDDESANEEEDTIKVVEMLVSAKHLMLASPVFNAMFKHDFLEGETLRSNGRVDVPLPDDDTKAMEIILNITHGRLRRVPREVTLDTMTAISVLVDKYQMHEVVELNVEIWMAHLKPLIPKFFSPEFYKWLSIAWVFKLEADFKHLTWIAIRESAGANAFLQPLPDPSLPLPEILLAEIQDQRRKAISDTLDIVTVLKDKLTAPSPGTIGTLWARNNNGSRVCTSIFGSIDIDNKRYACEGMILGTLLKGLSDHRMWPPPATSYSGISFKSVSMIIRSLKITSLCDTIQNPALFKTPAASMFGSSVSNMQQHAHGQMKWMHDQLDLIESQITGLELKIFGK